MTDIDTSSTKTKKKHRFFHKVLDKTIHRNEAEKPMEISGPTEFKHESHIGWTADNGFDIINIPQEWRQLFQAAGIKKKELKNPETVEFIKSVIGQNINDQKLGVASGGTTQPQPIRSRPPPPPPPTQSMGGNKPPPPIPGAEIRPLPQKHHPTTQQNPIRQMAQQQPPVQQTNRKLPTTINGKPIPVHQNFILQEDLIPQIKQQQQQQQQSNEPLIQQEYKSQYKLDEPLQPTQKHSPPQQTQQPPQTQQSYVYNPQQSQQSQTYTYQNQLPPQQYTYQNGQQQQSNLEGYNNYYQQKPAVPQQPPSMIPAVPQQQQQPIPPQRRGVLPQPPQQQQQQIRPTPPPVPTSKRPQLQTTPIQQQTMVPPMIPRTTQQQQPQIVVDRLKPDIMPPPPPPIMSEKVGTSSPLPPPATVAPPPPPPKATAPTAPPPAGLPPIDGTRANLMDSIRGFGGAKHLKKVDPNEPLPDLKELKLGDAGNRSLVDTLAAAMAQRRAHLGEEAQDDEDDSDWEN